MSDMPADNDIQYYLTQYQQPEIVREAKANEAADEFIDMLGSQTEDILTGRLIAGSIRMTAIRDEGLRLGVIAGQNARIAEINAITSDLSGYLSQIFSFNGVVHDNRVLLPSIGVSNRVFEQLADEAQAEVKTSYTVLEEATMITRIPTYRDYIVLNPVEKDTVHTDMLPESAEETRVWREAFRRGFMTGDQLADAMFMDGLYELHEDLVGRMTYLDMVDLNMIEPIRIVRQDNGVSYIDRTMNIGEEIFSIEDTPNFTSSDNWKVAWQVGEEFLAIRNNPYSEQE